jgi:YfiH family protein
LSRATLLQFKRLAGLTADGGRGTLVHGVTAREGGASSGPYASLNLGRSTGDAPAAVAENARRLAEALESPVRARFPHQVHGRDVWVLEDHPAGDGPRADAVATALEGAPVGVLGADCPGVLLVDPVRRALAVVHSGRGGTLLGVVPAAIETLARRFGSRAQDLRAGIGPGICAASYEVGPEVEREWRAGFPRANEVLARGRGDRFHLDVPRAIAIQLEAAGVPASNVETFPLCTFTERDRFFSHRRDGPRTGRHALVAMWQKA